MTLLETGQCATLRRVSDDVQDTRNQQGELDAYVAERGYTVVKTFDLPAVSASRGMARHEAALDEAVADMTAGRYSVLVVVHSSRLDRRDEDDQLDLLLRMRKAGGRIESVREPQFGRTDIAGRVLTLLAQYENAQYSRDLSGHVKAANARIDATGGFRGGRPPFGYQVTGVRYARMMQPDPALAPVILELFERAARGQSVPVIQAWLAVHGITKPASTITAMIRRPVYWTGRYEVTDYSGVVRVHITEPLVSPDTWRAANAALDARPSTNARPRLPRQPDYSGRLRCGYCSGKAYRAGGAEGKRTRTYYCKRCHRGWHADTADELTEQLMLADRTPEYDIVIITSATRRAERLEVVRDALRDLPGRGLPDEEEDEVRKQLRAERAEVEALPLEPAPRRELRHTGRTWAQAWTAMNHAERCSYLVGHDFLVVLMGRGRDVTVERVWPEEDG